MSRDSQSSQNQPVQNGAAEDESPAELSLENHSDGACNGEYEEGYDNYEEYEEEDCGEENAAAPGSNQMTVAFSYTLMNQVRQVARMEGVSPEDFVLELIAEGVTRRAFEDASRPTPSHLMTRTGYVPPEADGYQAPKLSHHYNANGNQNYGNGNQRRYNNNNGNGNNNNRKFNRPGYQGGNRYNNNANGNANGNSNGNSNGNQNSRFDPRRK